MKYISVLFTILLLFSAVIIFMVAGDGDLLKLSGLIENEIEKPEAANNAAVNINNISIQKNAADRNFKSDIDITENAIIYFPKKDYDIITVFDNKTENVYETDFEEYLIGVVFSEMPSSFESEALMAQAVAARSFCFYKMYNMDIKPDDKHPAAAVCNDPAHCKAYMSREEAVKKWNLDTADPAWEKIQSAVSATRGEILVYKNEPAVTVFHAMSGRKTESAQNLWGGEIPYLVSVDSPEADHSDSIKDYNVTVSIIKEEFLKTLKNFNGEDFLEADDEKFIGEFVYDNSGRVESVTVAGIKISGRDFRDIFSLRSADFTIGYIDGIIKITTTGYGHGVGMSQYGANLMAKEGNSYRDILSWYYKDVDLIKIDDFKDK